MIYLDTSALLKLVKNDEPEGPALRDHIRRLGQPGFVSSRLLTVESRRGVLRKRPDALSRLDVLLADVLQLDITSAVVERASRLPDPLLRSLDAIHLATALLVRDDVDELLTYDDRLTEAARTHGIPTSAPA